MGKNVRKFFVYTQNTSKFMSYRQTAALLREVLFL